MPPDSIKYKSIDPGCVLDIQAMTSDHMEQRLISNYRRDKKPSAGLIIETYQAFSPGTMVVMEIAFQESARYRSRGIVAWFVPGIVSDAPNRIGVRIFGMKKLDADGIPITETLPPLPPMDSMSAPPPMPSTRSSEPPPPLPTPDENDFKVPSSVPAPPVDAMIDDEIVPPKLPISLEECDTDAAETVQLVKKPSRDYTAATDTPPDEQKDTTPIHDESVAAPEPDASERKEEKKKRRSSHPPISSDTMHNRWELLTQCALPLKTADWSRAPHFQEEKSDVSPLDGRVAMQLSPPKFRRRIKGITLSNSEKGEVTPQKEALPSQAPHTFVAFNPNLSSLDLDVDVYLDGDFDTEGAMIDAFDNMHKLFSQRDRVSAARFAVSLARRLITSETGTCYIISRKKYELIPAVTSPESDKPWAAARKSARHGLLGVAMQTGSAIRIDNPGANAEYAFEKGEEPPKNILIAPIASDGYIVGALELRGSPRATGFTQGEADVLTYIGSSLAEYMHNSLPEERSSTPGSPY